MLEALRLRQPTKTWCALESVRKTRLLIPERDQLGHPRCCHHQRCGLRLLLGCDSGSSADCRRGAQCFEKAQVADGGRVCVIPDAG